jgi:hypothetical protein
VIDRFEVRLATAADEPDLRALVGAVAMPGAVAVRFAREPDYFLGTTVMGEPCDVVVARDRATGVLAGCACRAERLAFVNGAPERLGYLGQVRVAEGYRGAGLLALGARLMRARTPPGQLAFGVLARENPRAIGALVGARPPGGVRAVRLGGLTTCAVLLRPRSAVRLPGVDVRPANTALLPDLVAFLRAEGARRQFFPAYALEDLTGGAALRDLAPADVQVAWRGDRIVGTLAVWDQSGFKQDVVAGYGPPLRRWKPLVDAAARLVGARPLTPPGAAIPLAFAALMRVAADDPAVFRALLAAGAEAARTRGMAFLMVGLADADPLLAVARRFLHVPYRSDLYALAWGEDPTARLDGRVPQIEISTL